MTYDNPKGGIGYAAEFQSSALPFVTSSQAPPTGSPVRIDLPKVSRFITISNRESNYTSALSFGFTRNGVLLGNKYIVQGTQSITLELRVRELWIQAETGALSAYSLCAGLTNISRDNMPVLSGTLPDGSAGWTGVG